MGQVKGFSYASASSVTPKANEPARRKGTQHLRLGTFCTPKRPEGKSKRMERGSIRQVAQPTLCQEAPETLLAWGHPQAPAGCARRWRPNGCSIASPPLQGQRMSFYFVFWPTDQPTNQPASQPANQPTSQPASQPTN